MGDVLTKEDVRALRENLYTPGWFELHAAEAAMLALLKSHEALCDSLLAAREELERWKRNASDWRIEDREGKFVSQGAFNALMCANDSLRADLSAARDCGQEGVCARPPGCQRHWEERNRELAADRAAAVKRAEKAERELRDAWAALEARHEREALRRRVDAMAAVVEAARVRWGACDHVCAQTLEETSICDCGAVRLHAALQSLDALGEVDGG